MILFLLLPFSHHAAASPYSGAKSRDSMTGNNNFAESNILGLDPQFALSRAGIEGSLFGVGDLPRAVGWRTRSLLASMRAGADPGAGGSAISRGLVGAPGSIR